MLDPTAANKEQMPSPQPKRGKHTHNTYTMIDEVGNVAIVSSIHCILIINVIQVEQIGGSLFIVDMTPPLCLLCGDDLDCKISYSNALHKR